MDPSSPRAVAIVLAGGSGTRLGLADGRNKVYLPLGGLPLLAWSLRTLDGHPLVRRTVVVVRPGDEREALAAASAAGVDPAPTTVPGGATRSASESAGVRALAGTVDPSTVVLVHDGARPFLPVAMVDALVAAAAAHGAAVPGLALDPSTVRRDGDRLRALDPSRLRRVQTPQAFTAEVLLAAVDRAAREGIEGLDTAELVAAAGGPAARVVPGDDRNIKVTTPDDVARAEAIARRWPADHDPVPT
ncbi:IspD/TarI family cytidylyltransferase [Actinomarinicola tropica]|uniref:NTP transferase domain-containing protein n=1 Tax=Actinomarinicola tropica TaxID=2789776 RepID=A0A5Q2RLZ3_9ACTN|nr:2-C-methyl-D-erythritol 4-phosphate cytidylyltransferase [Actinomarinicola tropica]QGG95591.1 NTP transferase domain-containing protein [Actinomarinicola tropica]